MQSPEPITLRPIGRVHNQVLDSQDASFDWSQVVSRIELEEQYAGYTFGLDKYTHLLVIFWMDRPRKKQLEPLVYPCGDKTRSRVGLFASRSPHRPNPLGLKLVELLELNGNLITVRGLDALNNTPVLDIKPYHGGYDSVL
jgi:tRNA-Thr(GGU) m(6)t(6)A37 methyltransferase TsaA